MARPARPALDVGALRAQASRASTLLGAMCNEKRLMILCQLVAGERSVNELAHELDARQSTISQHLALLRRDGFVTARREGQMQLYSLAGNEARTILETLQSLYCDPVIEDA
jgi:DNA-binding transcriptional ArsR family regulator